MVGAMPASVCRHVGLGIPIPSLARPAAIRQSTCLHKDAGMAPGTRLFHALYFPRKWPIMLCSSYWLGEWQCGSY